MKLTTLDEKISALPAGERRKVGKRLKEIIAEDMTMRELRKAQHITQEAMAKKLGVKQEQVSRLERRTDMHISTLRKTIEAMGGELVLTAKFADGAPVRLTGLADLDA